ncbi:MFS transporter, partial [Thermoproteota archaeon]
FTRIKVSFGKPLIQNLFIISFLFVLASSALPVVLPLIGQSLYEFGSVEISYFFMYIGLIHIFMQGVVIDLLPENFREEKLISVVLLIKAFGMFFIPFSPNIAFFVLFITINSGGYGLTNTFIASLFSKNTSQKEQGSVMGIVQSVDSLARILGPIIAGFLFEYAGIATPFLVSAILLVFASTIGYRTFHRMRNQKKGN